MNTSQSTSLESKRYKTTSQDRNNSTGSYVQLQRCYKTTSQDRNAVAVVVGLVLTCYKTTSQDRNEREYKS